MKRLIFVCTGNTCRSPMAELILKKKFKEKSITGIKVISAGLSATAGEKMSKNSNAVLRKLGINPYNFRSKQLTQKMLLTSDMVICMTQSHKDYLKGYDNVFTMQEITGIGDIIDPYGGNLQTYKATQEQISLACEEIVRIILK